VFNHKATALIDNIEGAEFVGLDYLPKKPGIYIYHPIPDVDDDAMTRLLWRVYQRGNMGIFYDEGTMINARDPANKALLTQGREKRIPMITASQRPVGLARNVITEADFIQTFQLTDDDDIKRIREIVPFDMREYMKTKANEEPKLGQFYSLWYDVKKNVLLRIAPVEGGEERILEDFRNALQPVDNRRRIFL
jgi:hypothetical protein